MLEEVVESLRGLPGQVAALDERVTRVEGEILHLRTDMRGEFSAMRAEMATKKDLAEGLAAVRAEIGALRDEVREDIAGLGRDMVALFETTQRQMRMLYEDVVARIAALGNGGGRDSTPEPGSVDS